MLHFDDPSFSSCQLLLRMQSVQRDAEQPAQPDCPVLTCSTPPQLSDEDRADCLRSTMTPPSSLYLSPDLCWHAVCEPEEADDDPSHCPDPVSPALPYWSLPSSDALTAALTPLRSPGCADEALDDSSSRPHAHNQPQLSPQRLSQPLSAHEARSDGDDDGSPLSSSAALVGFSPSLYPVSSRPFSAAASRLHSQQAGDEQAATSSVGSSRVEKRGRSGALQGLSSAERTQRKRRRHREFDAQRRQREQAVVQTLRLLTQEPLSAASGSLQQSAELSLDDGDAEDTEADARDQRRACGHECSSRDKVSVLERAARRMQDMKKLIAELAELCRGEQVTSRALFCQLQAATQRRSLPASASSSSRAGRVSPSASSQLADFRTASQSLYSSFFLSATVGMYYILAQTGTVLDVNSRCLDITGWKREHVVDRLLTAPYHWIMAQGESSDVSESELSRLDQTRYLVQGSDGRMVPAQGKGQYGRTIRLQRELYQGLHSQVTLVWRCQLRDRRLHDVTVSQWVGSVMDVDDGQGDSTQRPAYVVGLIQQIQCVE